MGLLMPKYKLEFWMYDNMVLEQGTNDRKKIGFLAKRGAMNKPCDTIYLYEYRGLMQGYVIIDEGSKQSMLGKYK